MAKSKLVKLLATLKPNESVTFTVQQDRMTALVKRRTALGDLVTKPAYFSLRSIGDDFDPDDMVALYIDAALRKVRSSNVEPTDARHQDAPPQER